MILGIRTDSATTELYLLDSHGEKLAEDAWESGRELSVQLHKAIEKLLSKCSAEYKDLEGVVVFEGPGSFTGLRIGITVANALSYSLAIPIAKGGGDEWIAEAIKSLQESKPGEFVTPHYGGEANITKPRK